MAENGKACVSCHRDDRIKKASHAEGRSDGKATYICANCGLMWDEMEDNDAEPEEAGGRPGDGGLAAG